MERSPLARLVDLLVGGRFVFLAIAVGLSAAAWPIAQDLELDQSIESLYADDDPNLQTVLESNRLFGGNQFVILAWPVKDLFDPRGRLEKEHDARIRRFSERLRKVPGVNPESIQDLAAAIDPQIEGLSRRDKLLYRLLIKPSNVRKVMERLLVSEDASVAAILLRIFPEAESEVARRDIINGLRATAKAFADDEAEAGETPFDVYVVGEPVLIDDTFRYVDEDAHTLFLAALAILAIVLLLLFRSVRFVLLPIAVVGASILWTKAALVLLALELSMVSSMLNSLVTIIGIATCTHLTVRYRELRKTMSPAEAVRQALIELLPPIFWTCATTGAGFGSLLISDVEPIASFGLIMATATMVVVAAVALIIPGGVLLGKFDSDPRRTFGERSLSGVLVLMSRSVRRFPLVFIIGFIGIFTAAGMGLPKLEVESDFTKNFIEETPIVQDLRFFEGRLGGAGTWEVNFPAPRNFLFTDEYVARVEKLTERLRKMERPGKSGPVRLTKAISLTDGIALVPRKLIFLEIDIAERIDRLKRYQPEVFRILYNAEAGRMRIMLLAYERQSAADKRWLIEEARRLVQEEFPEGGKIEQALPPPPEINLDDEDEIIPEDDLEPKPLPMTELQTKRGEAGGIFLLLTYLIESLIADQLRSFLLAAAAIGLMMTLAFRNLWIGLGSLLPNVFPIALVIGGLGWFDVPINMGTAMIASVSMGLTVDSSIHYLSAYRRNRGAGLSHFAALEQTQREVGRALVFANFALIAGFLVLTLSHFVPLIYFGILVSAAMLGGLIGNLLLLPLLLNLLYGREGRKPTSPTVNEA